LTPDEEKIIINTLKHLEGTKRFLLTLLKNKDSKETVQIRKPNSQSSNASKGGENETNT
jgi:hypothetical protein